ncbi:MAG TPA: glycosyltransferase, partial [Chromatiaceae bacterium]|nr:glycosyltransferase [Chromatiaceae bacterium]
RLPRTLATFRDLEPPSRPWELLPVNNNCTDNTLELLEEAHWRPEGVEVRILFEEKLGLSNARNCALKNARGQYLLFIDDDETPDPKWLTAYEQAMLEHRPDALGGRIEVLFEEGDQPPWLQDELLGFLGRLDHGKADWLTEPNTPFYGGNFAVRLAIFDEVGNFDADLGRKGEVNTGGEDTEFYRRMLASNHRIRWVPEAVIYHRIQAGKLRRSYFLELHYRQGLIEGSRKRGDRTRIPPLYLLGQCGRAARKALGKRFREGKNHSLRSEMNLVYFLGYLRGWMFA